MDIAETVSAIGALLHQRQQTVTTVESCTGGGIAQALTSVAAEKMDVPPAEIRFEEGLMRYNGSTVPMGEVVGWMKQQGLEPKTTFEYWAPKTQPLGTGGDMHFAFSFGAQAALVEVDMTTGEVHVRKIIAAHDIGRALNPLTLRGQIEGGIVMALGYTLTENYIQEDGKPWTHLMARYKMPSITHAPEIVSHVVEHAVAAGPFGAKGAGELPSIPTSAAITNAIHRATGVRVRSLPVDQDGLLRAMKAGADELEMGWGDSAPIPEVSIEGDS